MTLGYHPPTPEENRLVWAVRVAVICLAIGIGVLAGRCLAPTMTAVSQEATPAKMAVSPTPVARP